MSQEQVSHNPEENHDAGQPTETPKPDSEPEKPTEATPERVVVTEEQRVEPPETEAPAKPIEAEPIEKVTNDESPKNEENPKEVAHEKVDVPINPEKTENVVVEPEAKPADPVEEKTPEEPKTEIPVEEPKPTESGQADVQSPTSETPANPDHQTETDQKQHEEKSDDKSEKPVDKEEKPVVHNEEKIDHVPVVEEKPEPEVHGILVKPGQAKVKKSAGIMVFDEPKKPEHAPGSGQKNKMVHAKIEGKEGLVAKKKAQQGTVLRRKDDPPSTPEKDPKPNETPASPLETSSPRCITPFLILFLMT